MNIYMKQLTSIFLTKPSYLVWGLLTLLLSANANAGTPNFTVTFSPDTIISGQVSTMTYTIDNSANEVGVSGLAFTNTLPSDLTIASPANIVNDCPNGYYTADEGTNSISFNDYRLGSGHSCTFSIDITANTEGTHTNTTSVLSTSEGSVAAASDDLTIDNSGLTLDLAFSDTHIAPNEITTMTYTLDATGIALNIISVSMTHNLDGFTISDAPNIGGSCSTIDITADAGSTRVRFNSGSLTIGEVCTVTVDVTSDTTGSYTTTAPGVYHTFSNITSGTTNTATATFTVTQPFMYATFPASSSPGSTVDLTYTIINSERSDITNLNFSNDLEATLTGLTATALPANGFCGDNAVMTGASNLSVSGISLTSGSECSFTVSVLIPASAAAGSYTNTTSTINLDLDGASTTKSAISNTLLIQPAPAFSASILTNPVSAGDDVTFRFTISNNDGALEASSIAFSMPINDILAGTVFDTLPAANTCGTGSTFFSSVTSDVTYFNLSDGKLAAGETCTFDVVITLAESASIGNVDFSTSVISAIVNNSAVYGQSVTTTLEVAAAPTLIVDLSDENGDALLSATPGQTIKANFQLNYSISAASDATDVGFTLDLNAALANLVSVTALQNDICGNGSSFSGTSTLTLSGATLSPDSECSFSVDLTIPADASPGTATLTSSSVSATVSGLSAHSGATSVDLQITGLSFSKAFIPDTLLANGTGVLRYTISNAPTASTATELVFTDNLSSILSGITSTALPTTPCGPSSAITGPSFLVFSNGELAPGETCTFDVNILIPDGAADSTYISVSSTLSAKVDGVNTTTPAASTNLTIESLTVLLTTSVDASTNANPIPVAIDFSRDVTGFTVDDLTVTNGTADNLAGSGQSYTVDIIPTADGTVTIDLPADMVFDAVDGAVQNPASNQLSIEYASTPDVPIPTIAISAPSISETTNGPVTYTVSYANTSEINLTEAHISLNNSGTSATVTVTDGTTETATVTLTDISGDGTLGISIAEQSARNDYQLAPAAGPSATFIVDNTNPEITISDAVDPDINTAFSATITFSEAVSGFDESNIDVSNANLSNFAANSTSIYSVLVTPISEGNVTLDVAASVATDSVGNHNNAAPQHVVNYDITAPTLTINGDAGPVNGPISVTFDFDEDVSDFVEADISVTNASLSSFAASSASSYSVIVTPSSDGLVTIDVAASTALDLAGNANTAATQYSFNYDTTAPLAQSLTPINDGTDIDPSTTLSITFDEAIVAGNSNNLITVKQLNDNTIVAAIAADGAEVVISDNTATITLASDLAQYSDFYVTIDNQAFIDTAGNNYLGFNDDTSWRFKTINLPPSTNKDHANVNENDAVIIEVLNNDSGDNFSLNPASLTIATAATNGQTAVNITTGKIVYKPNEHFNGSDSFSYVISDMLGTFSDETTVTITVNPVNDAPMANDDVVSTNINEPLTIDVLANDSDIDQSDSINSDALQISKTPQHGRVNIVNGKVYYQPDSDYSGSDSFAYNVSDLNGTVSNQAGVYINVVGTNQAPATSSDTATTTEDHSVTIAILDNDSDSDGSLDVSTVNLVSEPELGEITINNDGTVNYQPHEDVNGSDSFAYTVNDNEGALSAKTTVTVSIAVANDAPIAVDDQVTAINHVDQHIINVLGNDSDIDGTITAINLLTNASVGTAVVDSDKLHIIYTPAAGFSGTDSFSYQLTDNEGLTSTTATVTINEDSVNTPPLANDDQVQTDEEQYVDIAVLANDSDIDGRLIPMTLQIIDQPANGSVAVRSANGRILYTPNTNFYGEDHFSYQISDNSGATATATVYVMVNNLNDSPTVNDVTVQTDEDLAVAVVLDGQDNDDDKLDFVIITNPSNGILTGEMPNLSYQPNSDFNGEDQFTYSAFDGQASSTTATVSINVAALNDAPTALAQSINLNEDSSISIHLRGADAEGDSISYSITSQPSSGVLSGSDQDWTYTPFANVNGSDSFTFITNDGEFDSAPATINITIDGQNDQPVALGQSLTTNEDIALAITLEASDIDGDSLSYITEQWPSHGQLTGIAPNLTYTPAANYFGEDRFAFVANDGTLNSDLVWVEISVNSQNDQPTAQDLTVSTNEDSSLAISLIGLDKDGDDLDYQISQNPSNGSLQGTPPHLTYVPDDNFHGEDSFEYLVNDGQLDSTTAVVNLTITSVNDIPVATNDQYSQSGWALAEIDVLSNDSDIDTDNLEIIGASVDVGIVTFDTDMLYYTPVQGFVGQVSIQYNISDNNGGFANANVSVDISAAQGDNLIHIDLPDNISVNATGLFTQVNPGQATATDQQANPIQVTRIDNNNYFKPGVNHVYWQATDAQGNTSLASQVITVLPQVSIDQDQIVMEGSQATVNVRLNGTAPSYPLTIPYTVTGSSDSIDDHSLHQGVLSINSGTQAKLKINLYQDDLNEGSEALIISLDQSLNLAQQQTHTLWISEQALNPQLELSVSQAEINGVIVNQQDGLVKINGVITHQDDASLFEHQWHHSEQITNLSSQASQLHFDPSELDTGTYSLSLYVQHRHNQALNASRQVNIKIINKPIVLGNQDTDMDGISDSIEGYHDQDNDGIFDYLDALNQCNVMAMQVNDINKHLIETEPGLCLKLGPQALSLGQHSPVLSGQNRLAQTNEYDLIIDQLSITGSSHSVVLPLQQALSHNAQLQIKAQQQWFDFIEDGADHLMSSPGAPGYCPPPGDVSWQNGLNQGHWCVQVSLSDGGINDSDQSENGAIVLRSQVSGLKVNALPQAIDDQVQLEQGHSILIDVLANDSDSDGDSLQIVTASATHGQVIITATQQLSYHPAQHFNGNDQIEYTITDHQGAQATATVEVLVKAPVSTNPPPEPAEPAQNNSSASGGSIGYLLWLGLSLIFIRRHTEMKR